MNDITEKDLIKISFEYAADLLNDPLTERKVYSLDKKKGEYVKVDSVPEKTAKTYYVRKLATEEDLEKLILLKKKEKELKEEIEKLTNHVGLDAELMLDGTDYTIYEYISPFGTVCVNDTTTVTFDRPAKLKKLLDDADGELISEEVVYKAKDRLKNIVKIIKNEDYVKESIGDFLDKFGSKYPNPKGLNPKEIEKKLKKKYETNVRLFKNTFEMDGELAEAAAKNYSMVMNYNEIMKFLTMCEIDIGNEEDVSNYLQDLLSYAAVDTKHSVTVKTA